MLENMDSICCEIIKTCPLSCLHCSAKSNMQTSKLIPFHELKNIVDQAFQNKIKTFYISGGEPLLYPELEKLIQYITSYNITPVIYSSGILPNNKDIQSIPKETLASLENSGLNTIAFSIYSLDSKIHDKITNTSHSLETLKRTILNAKEIFQKTNIELSFLPLSNTWSMIDEIVEFCHLNRIYKLNILKLINQGRAKESGIILQSLSTQDELLFLERLNFNKQIFSNIEISKLYDCNHYEHLQVSPHTAGVNEYFITSNQEILPGRRFRN